jgi:hypothetical protein
MRYKIYRLKESQIEKLFTKYKIFKHFDKNNHEFQNCSPIKKVSTNVKMLVDFEKSDHEFEKCSSI